MRVEGLRHAVLTQERLQELPEGSQCSICIQGFVTGLILSRTTCGHVFHYVCLMQWLQTGSQQITLSHHVSSMSRTGG